MPGIFISYRRDDSADASGRIFDRLSAHFGREQVFLDVDGIGPGTDFVRWIEERVLSCSVLLAVIGPGWLSISDARGQRRLNDPEDFVRIEITKALEQDIRVIPVLVGAASMPQRDQLPEALTALARLQGSVVSHATFGRDMNHLIQTVEEVLSAGAGQREDAGRVSLGGVWAAEVTYDWGARHLEKFSLKVDEDVLMGTASFLGSPRSLMEGKVSGDRIAFSTRTQEVSSDWDHPKAVQHYYRGRVSGDEIDFVMQTESQSSGHLPIEFKAKRVSR